MSENEWDSYQAYKNKFSNNYSNFSNTLKYNFNPDLDYSFHMDFEESCPVFENQFEINSEDHGYTYQTDPSSFDNSYNPENDWRNSYQSYLQFSSPFQFPSSSQYTESPNCYFTNEGEMGFQSSDPLLENPVIDEIILDLRLSALERSVENLVYTMFDSPNSLLGSFNKLEDQIGRLTTLIQENDIGSTSYNEMSNSQDNLIITTQEKYFEVNMDEFVDEDENFCEAIPEIIPFEFKHPTRIALDNSQSQTEFESFDFNLQSDRQDGCHFRIPDEPSLESFEFEISNCDLRTKNSSCISGSMNVERREIFPTDYSIPSLELNSFYDPFLQGDNFNLPIAPSILINDEHHPLLNVTDPPIDWATYAAKSIDPLTIPFRVYEKETTPRVKIRDITSTACCHSPNFFQNACFT